MQTLDSSDKWPDEANGCIKSLVWPGHSDGDQSRSKGRDTMCTDVSRVYTNNATQLEPTTVWSFHSDVKFTYCGFILSRNGVQTLLKSPDSFLTSLRRSSWVTPKSSNILSVIQTQENKLRLFFMNT